MSILLAEIVDGIEIFEAERTDCRLCDVLAGFRARVSQKERTNICSWLAARTDVWTSACLQGFLDCLGRAFDDEKISPCRPLWLARTLFPMA